jgi:hypothetical protein
MPSVNLSGLRNIRELKALINAGEPIELRDRRIVIGQIIPESAWPEFEARQRQTIGPAASPSERTDGGGENGPSEGK